MPETDGDAQARGERQARHSAYWRANLRLLGGCLLVWFVVSFGFGIVLAEELNRIQFMGFKLGFWFAQQGSIYVFLALIFFYAWAINRLDRRFGVAEDQDDDS